LLLAGRVLDQHKAAWLIDQAVAEVIDLARDDTPAKEMTTIGSGWRSAPTTGILARMCEALGRELSA
jgi:hypothetical protein